MDERKIILASASPRRAELLSSLGVEFTVIPSEYEENIEDFADIEQTVNELSFQKANDVHKSHFHDIIIGADTIVVLDGKILCKPKDKLDATKMLKSLSGGEHKVYTAVTLLCEDKRISFCDTTSVTFFELNEKEISDYVKSGEPLDKAGAYGIQGKGAYLVKKIEGDYYSVMGLPIARTVREIETLKESLKNL